MKQNKKTVGIVGLGLIGGSLGLDLQTLGWEVHGLAHREITAQKARERGLAQFVDTDPAILSNCDLVILAMPLAELLRPEAALLKAIPKAAVVTDVGSVKTPVIEVWQDLHQNFVPSHPMAGTEGSGVESGKKNLFKNRPWVATPNNATDDESLEVIHHLAIALGSKWFTTKAENHDQAVALISHLPVLVSAALLRTVGTLEDHTISKLAASIASSGFADTTRVGSGNPVLGTSMAANNTNAILKTLKSYRLCLDELESLILKGQWQELQMALEQTQALRPKFLNSTIELINPIENEDLAQPSTDDKQ